MDIWGARDKNGWLLIYTKEPWKYYSKENPYESDSWTSNGTCIGAIESDKKNFPEIKWENSPVLMELKIKDNGTK